MGYLPRYAPYAAKMPWLMNLRDTLPGAAKLSEMVAGFSARRSLPKWRTDIFRNPLEGTAGERDVVLFAITVNRYFERENLDAALVVLNAGGYRVHIAKPLGRFIPPIVLRPHISFGRQGR